MQETYVPSIPNSHIAHFERDCDVRLAYVEFCNIFNTLGASFTYTLMCDYYFTLYSANF